MKKLLFTLPVVLLVAAGCNSSQITSQPTYQTQPIQQSQTTPTQPISTSTKTTTANNSLVIKEWGIQIEKPTGMSDLQYSVYNPDNSGKKNIIAFTTQQLVKLDESIGGKCLAYHTIGTIARYTESEFNYAQKNGPGIANYVKLEAYYYAFSSPQEGCSANQNFLNLESQQTASLGTKLSTLQTIAQ